MRDLELTVIFGGALAALGVPWLLRALCFVGVHEWIYEEITVRPWGFQVTRRCDRCDALLVDLIPRSGPYR